MAVDVFVSYHSATSQNLARTIKERLEEVGISCWFSGGDLGGGDYARAIMEALSQCRVFVLLLNHASSESVHVLNELEIVTNRLAKKEEVLLLPFHVADKEIDPAALYYIQRHHWIDATKRPMNRCIEDLVAQIQEVLRTEEDRLEEAKARKKEAVSRWVKLLCTCLAAAGLIYTYRSLPEICADKRLYYLIHLLAAAAPVLLLLFEPHPKLKMRASSLAQLMLAAVFLLWWIQYFGVDVKALLHLKIDFDWFKDVRFPELTREFIWYTGAYVMLLLYPWNRELMRSGAWRRLWTVVCIGTGLWLSGVSCVFLLSVCQLHWAPMLLCLWGVAAGAFIVIHHVVEWKQLRKVNLR